MPEAFEFARFSRMSQNRVPSLDVYQLNNLVRHQAKFLMIALIEPGEQPPGHALLNFHHKVEVAGEGVFALDKIIEILNDASFSKEWPIILVSRDGKASHALAAVLDEKGFLNAFHLTDGWESLSKASGAGI